MMWGREGLYGRPVLGCERVPPQVSTGNRTRATIKALPTTLHYPRPYGEEIAPASMERLAYTHPYNMTANMLQYVWHSLMGTRYRNSKHDKALSMLQWI